MDVASSPAAGASTGGSPAAAADQPIDDGDNAHEGPGGPRDPTTWDHMWAEREASLEGLSRAMAAELRHGSRGSRGLTVSACRPLDTTRKASAADVLLVAVASMNKNGGHRFRVTEGRPRTATT